MYLAEGGRGWVPFTFAISLSQPSDLPIRVNYATLSSGRGAALGGTASTPDADYIVVSSTTLEFAPGQLTKVITVYGRGDTLVEGDETFFVRLSAPVNARLATSTGIGTILNDDRAVSPTQSPSPFSGGIS